MSYVWLMSWIMSNDEASSFVAHHGKKSNSDLLVLMYWGKNVSS